MSSIRKWWEEEYNYLDGVAKASKNSQSVWFKLSRRYAALTEEEKKDITQVLIEWLKSENMSKRSDALWLIREHKIPETKEALNILCHRLKSCKIPENPEGYHQREDALEILKLLG